MNYTILIAGVGLAGKTLYDLSQGNYAVAVTDLVAALAVFGVHFSLQSLHAKLDSK